MLQRNFETDIDVGPKKLRISYSTKDQLNRSKLGKRKLMESRTNLAGKFIHKNMLNISINLLIDSCLIVS